MDGIERKRAVRGWHGGFVHENATKGGHWISPAGTPWAMVGFAVNPFVTEFKSAGKRMRFSYSPGDGVIIPARVPHETSAYGEQVFVQCGVYPGVFETLNSEWALRARPPEEFIPLLFTREHPAMRLAALMRGELDFEVPGLFVLEALALGLAAQILRQREPGTLAPPIRRRAASKAGLRRAAMLMRDRHAASLALADLAAAAGLSVAHFSREFRAVCGLAPHQFLLRRRLEWALAAVRDGRFPRDIAQAAQAAGFSDHAHLSRVCRRLTGLPPSAFAAGHGAIPRLCPEF